MVAISSADSGFFNLGGVLFQRGSVDFTIYPSGRVAVVKNPAGQQFASTLYLCDFSDFYDSDIGDETMPFATIGDLQAKIDDVAASAATGGGGAPTGAAGGDLAGTYPNPAIGKFITGSFTATADGTTTAFTHTIPAGYTMCITTVESNIDPLRAPYIFITSCQISGTTLTVNIYQLNAGGGGISAMDNESITSPVQINYLLSK